MAHVTEHIATRPHGRAEPLNSIDDFEVIPSGAALAAEIRGIDFSQPVSEAVKEADIEALEDLGASTYVWSGWSSERVRVIAPVSLTWR